MNDAVADHRANTIRVRAFLLGLCIALPWLSPLTGGPSPGVPPMLVTLACAGFMVLLWMPSLRGGAQPALARILAWSWLVAAALSSVMGLLQYAGLAPQGLTGISAADVGLAYANLRQRNQLASLLSIGLVSLAYLAGMTGARRLGAVRTAVLLVLLMAGHAATASRTGALQLVLLSVVLFLWCPKEDGRLRWVSWALLPLYLGWSWLLPRVLGWWMGSNPPNVMTRIEGASVDCHSRLTLWGNVLQLIRLRPWGGWGWGELDYAHFITPYEGPRFCEILDNAHNLPLHLAVELGIPLALLACVVFAAWVVRQKPWREVDADRRFAWLVLGVVGVHSLLEYPLWYGPFQVAAVCCILVFQKPVACRRTVAAARAIRIAVATVVLVCTVYAACDYHRVTQLYLPLLARDPAYRFDTFAKVADSYLFRQQVQFAELTTTELKPDNAAYLHSLAQQMLHFSPEPRVIERLIETSREVSPEDAAIYEERYLAAFPESHALWRKAARY